MKKILILVILVTSAAGKARDSMPPPGAVALLPKSCYVIKAECVGAMYMMRDGAAFCDAAVVWKVVAGCSAPLPK
jgi:hypothetical protein